MPRRDEHGYAWTQHRTGARSTKVMHGDIATRAMISEPVGGTVSVSIHGTCVPNPNPIPGDQPGAKYNIATLEEAEALIRSKTTPR